MTIEDALKDIEISFLQLEFAMKLLSYCELGKIDALEFDTDHEVVLVNGNLRFPAGHFSDPHNIVRSAAVAVSLAFGASALALDKAYEVAGVQKFPTSEKHADNLRTLVYMVRCAYAHGIAEPKWEVRGEYKRRMNLNIGMSQININFEELAGKNFDFKDLGGHRIWFLIKDAAIEALRAD